MTSYMDFVVLLNDAEDYLEQRNHPEAEALIQRARNALKKDLGEISKTLHQGRRVEAMQDGQRSH